MHAKTISSSLKTTQTGDFFYEDCKLLFEVNSQ